jgi:THO complex subunit 1
MAVSDAPQNSTAARLDELLQRARTVKRSTSIEPPLQVAELVPENEPLFNDINGEKDILATAVESAAKGVFYANIVSKPIVPQTSTNIGRHQQRSMNQSS